MAKKTDQDGVAMTLEQMKSEILNLRERLVWADALIRASRHDAKHSDMPADVFRRVKGAWNREMRRHIASWALELRRRMDRDEKEHLALREMEQREASAQ